MTSTTCVGSEVIDPENMDISESEAVTDLLANKTPNQRVQYLRREFHQTSEPIEEIRQPLLCDVYPDFRKDICRAYLRYSAFTAKVWVNYDGACKQFFVDRRVADCGKLVLSAKDKKRIEIIKSANIEVNRVVLEVGTAFRTLSQIVLRASLETGEIKAMNKPQTGEHPLLMSFLSDVCASFSGLTILDGQTGFTLGDLEQIANEMIRKPDSKTYFNYHTRWRVADEWMSTGRGFSSNPGYLRHLV